MSIPDGFVQDLNGRIDIVDLVGRYIALKKNGTRYVGVCPFHGDTNPSLSVNPERGFFYCFGCQAGGDAISFIRKVENLDFIASVRFIANLYGIPIPEVKSESDGVRKSLYEINAAAKILYQKYFASGKDGAPFRSYLLERGFVPDTLKTFEVGACPDSWDFAKNSMKNFDEDALVKSGILVKHPEKGNVYDRFRYRLMIPIIDSVGRTVGFGARIMRGEGPKYVNSPESEIFKKSELLFGFNLSKEVAKKENSLVIMEGYTDVMMAYQSGIRNCCAVMGTALTTEHIPIIKRFVDKVYLMFDGDSAGNKAAIKSLHAMANSGLNLYVADMPKESDPASVVKDEGAGRLGEILRQSETGQDWMIRIYSRSVRKKDLRDKISRLKHFVPFIMVHESETMREELVRKSAIEFGIQESAILEIIESLKGKQAVDADGISERLNTGDRLERNMLICLMNFPDTIEEVSNILDDTDFENSDYKSIFNSLIDLTKEG